jgi:L-lactate dehydrogenase complex protein LldG
MVEAPKMNSPRETILAALGTSGDPEAEYVAIERTYQTIGLLDNHKKLELFIERLIEYGTAVFPGTQSQIAAMIAGRLHARAAANIAVPRDIACEWLPAGFQFTSDDDLTYDQIESCDGVITGCVVAIAETGTIILDGSSSQCRRALTLLPDYHLCVVFENQVRETVPEAIHMLSPASSRPLTLISGPSATADIEMTRIQGVHGPRSMDVLLVSL